MSQILTRRAVVAAAPSAVVAASLPALAGGQEVFAKSGENPLDAELLALREPFDRTWRAYSAALNIHSAAERAAWDLSDVPADDGRRVAADRRHAHADALVDTTGDANREVVDEMCRRPARTIEGLAFKARVSLGLALLHFKVRLREPCRQVRVGDLLPCARQVAGKAGAEVAVDPRGADALLSVGVADVGARVLGDLPARGAAAVLVAARRLVVRGHRVRRVQPLAGEPLQVRQPALVFLVREIGAAVQDCAQRRA